MPTTAPPRTPRPVEPTAQPISAPAPMQAPVAPKRTAPAPAGSNVWRGEAACTAAGAYQSVCNTEEPLFRRICGNFVQRYDAIVIGSGPNGLVAANRLADAGLEVLVLEAADEPGGAVKTAELVEPGFRHDVFSSFYPLGAASPVLRALELERYGLRWRRAPLALAHPAPDGSCPV